MPQLTRRLDDLDGHFARAEVRRFDFERYGVPSMGRTVCAGPESTGGYGLIS